MFLKDNKYKDVIIAVLITFTFCIIIYKAFDILGPGITYFFKEFVSFINNPDGSPKYENTIQYAILRKEWAGRRAGGQSPRQGI